MILLESKAMPIIEALAKYAVEQIKEKTDCIVTESDILEELSDKEWIIVGGYAENEEYLLDMNEILSQIDWIISTYTEQSFDTVINEILENEKEKREI